MTRALATVLLLLCVAGTAQAKCRVGNLAPENNRVTMPGCPADVKALVDRAVNCQHWAGEDPYDNARGHEIDSAMAELKCERLSADYETLLRSHADDADALRAIEDADREFLLDFSSYN